MPLGFFVQCVPAAWCNGSALKGELRVSAMLGRRRSTGELDLFCSHMLARAGRWRNGILPRCVTAAVCTQLCGFGACLLCLFAVTCVVTPGLGIALATGTCHTSLWLVLGGKRVVVVANTRVCWCDSIGAKRKGAVSSSAPLVLIQWCNLLVFKQGFVQKSGIFGPGCPDGRSWCSWQGETCPFWLVAPLICQCSRSLMKQNCHSHRVPGRTLHLTCLEPSNQTAGERVYFV